MNIVSSLPIRQTVPAFRGKTTDAFAEDRKLLTLPQAVTFIRDKFGVETTPEALKSWIRDCKISHEKLVGATTPDEAIRIQRIVLEAFAAVRGGPAYKKQD